MQSRWTSVGRVAGMLLPLFASRDNPDDLGTGDTASAEPLMASLKDLGIRLWQHLPIGETDMDNSPYSPISSQALNWLTLAFAPSVVPGLSPDHLSAFAHRPFQEAGTVNYRLVRRIKRALLEAAFANFERGAHVASEQVVSFEEYAHENEWWLPQYATFHFLFDAHGHSD